jgi:hypothetical protein
MTPPTLRERIATLASSGEGFSPETIAAIVGLEAETVVGAMTDPHVDIPPLPGGGGGGGGGSAAAAIKTTVLEWPSGHMDLPIVPFDAGHVTHDDIGVAFSTVQPGFVLLSDPGFYLLTLNPYTGLQQSEVTPLYYAQGGSADKPLCNRAQIGVFASRGGQWAGFSSYGCGPLVPPNDLSNFATNATCVGRGMDDISAFGLGAGALGVLFAVYASNPDLGDVSGNLNAEEIVATISKLA